jgi:hypothetical protein
MLFKTKKVSIYLLIVYLKCHTVFHTGQWIVAIGVQQEVVTVAALGGS